MLGSIFSSLRFVLVLVVLGGSVAIRAMEGVVELQLPEDALLEQIRESFLTREEDDSLLMTSLPGVSDGGGAQDNIFSGPVGETVIGGSPSDPLRYPYYTFLEFYNSSGIAIAFCGGVLIHDDIVLTAAHCVGENTFYALAAVNLTSFVGPLRPDIDYYLRFSTSYLIHPGFLDTDAFPGAVLPNDIALISLNAPVPVNPVTINDDTRFPTDGSDSRIIGLGLTEDLSFPDELLEADGPVFSTDECEILGDTVGSAFHEDIQLCALSSGIGACSGDSGGPLLIVGSCPEEDVAVAVASFVFASPDLDGRCLPQYPTYFSRLPFLSQETLLPSYICAFSAVPPEYCLTKNRRKGKKGGTSRQRR